MPISLTATEGAAVSSTTVEQQIPIVATNVASVSSASGAVTDASALPSAAGLKPKGVKGVKGPKKSGKLSKKKSATSDATPGASAEGDKGAAAAESIANSDGAKGCRCLCRGMGPAYDCRTQFSAAEQAMFAKIRSSSRTTKRNFIHSYALVNCKRGVDEEPIPTQADGTEKAGPTPGKSRQRMEYRLCQRKVCKAVFMELQGIGKKMIAAAQQHVRDGEIALKKTKRRPSRHVHVIQAEEFLEGYAREHGTQQGGGVFHAMMYTAAFCFAHCMFLYFGISRCLCFGRYNLNFCRWLDASSRWNFILFAVMH